MAKVPYEETKMGGGHHRKVCGIPGPSENEGRAVKYNQASLW